MENGYTGHRNDMGHGGAGEDAAPVPAARQRTLREKKEERDRCCLVISGNIFIHWFLGLLCRSEGSKETKKRYLEKVLHAVFFFGQIHVPPIEPKEFIAKEHHERLKSQYPAPFEQCHSHLPTKTPCSIALDYVTETFSSTLQRMDQYLEKCNRELWQHVQETKLKAGEFTFCAAVIARSFYKDPRSKARSQPFYGASLSCKGWAQRKIMIDVSCLETWHQAVAYAVYHGGTLRAIIFPDGVWSKAMRFDHQSLQYQEKPPCRKCRQMFQKVNFRPCPRVRCREKWQYGNCAETEAFSKLLQGNRAVSEGIQSSANENIETFAIIKPAIRARVIEELRKRNFEVANLQFFEPECPVGRLWPVSPAAPTASQLCAAPAETPRSVS